jgi:Flp pilus assembly protein protease CpaA
MIANDLLLLTVFVWLLACAVQDWNSREVTNWITLPPLVIAVILRLAGFAHEPLLPVLVVIALLFMTWLRNRIGGADAKVSLALALLDMNVFIWAWLGLGLWYLGLRLYYGRKCDKRLPAFVGFAVGVAVLLVDHIVGRVVYVLSESAR